MPDAFGLGGGRDGLALSDFVVIGRLDAVDAIRAADRGLDGGRIVQVAADEFGAGGDERGGRRRCVLSHQGTDPPAGRQQVSGGGTTLVPGGPGDQDNLVTMVEHAVLLLLRFTSPKPSARREPGATIRPPPNRCQQPAARP